MMAATNSEVTRIRIRGRDTDVPAIQAGGRTILVTGGWLRTAEVKDEAHQPGETIPDPASVVERLKQWEAKPDLFTFSQKVGDTEPKHAYPFEWDDFAVIPITSYQEWLKRIRKDVKENLRRAKREGVEVRSCAYDDRFVEGIKRLCDETPIRQGKPFWHHGKPLEAIREVHGTYAERSEFIGAFFGEELIGFIKMVYTDNFAKTMHVISKEQFHQKRPTNALIAKAVEICEQKGVSYFIYGQYRFPGKKTSSLTDFKKANGFEEVRYPRYYVPLTLKGSLALKFQIHRDLRRWIPHPITAGLLKLRSRYYQKKRG